jgi:hypothetical protein
MSDVTPAERVGAFLESCPSTVQAMVRHGRERSDRYYVRPWPPQERSWLNPTPGSQTGWCIGTDAWMVTVWNDPGVGWVAYGGDDDGHMLRTTTGLARVLAWLITDPSNMVEVDGWGLCLPGIEEAAS